MLPYHTTANVVFTASKSYDIIIVTNSTAKVIINKLKNTQLQHKAGISSTLTEIVYTHTHTIITICVHFMGTGQLQAPSHTTLKHTHTHYESDCISLPYTSDRPQHFRYIHVTTASNKHW
jgi:hypothetical protein